MRPNKLETTADAITIPQPTKSSVQRLRPKPLPLGSAPQPANEMPEPEAPLNLAGGPQAIERFRGWAMAVSPGRVRPVHCSTRLIAHNVALGAAAILAERDRVERELPMLDLDKVEAVPELGVAVAWSAEHVLHLGGVPLGPVRARLARASVLRATLAASLEGAARSGLIPRPLLPQIRGERGPFDTAGDCLAYALLFERYEPVLLGKTPVTPCLLEEALQVSTELRLWLGAPPSRCETEGFAEAVDLRDRLGTLLADEYAAVRRAGAWLFGEEHLIRVPAPLDSARPWHRRRRLPSPPRLPREALLSTSGEGSSDEP